MAQTLRVPVVAVPSPDLVAYPLRHAGRLIAVVLDARRREVFHARYRPVPGGVQRVSDYAVGPAADLVAELIADLGVPRTLRDINIGPDSLDEIARRALAYEPVQMNPRKIERPEQVREILELAW